MAMGTPVGAITPRTRQARTATTAKAREWSALGDVVDPVAAEPSGHSRSPWPASGTPPTAAGDRSEQRAPLPQLPPGTLRKDPCMSRMGEHALADNRLPQLFASLDKDRDGKLNRADLRAAIIESDAPRKGGGGSFPDDESNTGWGPTAATAEAAAEAEVERLLQEMDLDGDGTLSYEEFHQLIRGQRARRAALYIEDGLSARSPSSVRPHTHPSPPLRVSRPSQRGEHNMRCATHTRGRRARPPQSSLCVTPRVPYVSIHFILGSYHDDR
jgi:hypothetical protein